MTREELAEIRARAEAASEGPWEWAGLWTFRKQTRASSLESLTKFVVEVSYADSGEVFLSSEADAKFLSHSRSDVPKLLAEVERLQKELRDTKIHLGKVQDSIIESYAIE